MTIGGYWNLGNQVLWTPFDPDMAATLTIGNGTLTANYALFYDTVFAEYHLIFGSTTSFVVALGADIPPITPVPNHDFGIACVGTIADASASARRPMFIEYVASVQRFGLVYLDTTPDYASITPTAPWTWATGDSLHWSLWYKAA